MRYFILLLVGLILVSGCTQKENSGTGNKVNEIKYALEVQKNETVSKNFSEKQNQISTVIKNVSERVEQKDKTEPKKEQPNQINWYFDDVWKSTSTPPTCPDQLILQTPADINLATSINYPGSIRGGQYKPHGGFGFEKSKPDDITVRVPQEGFVVGGVRYIQSGEVQYLFEIDNSCGIKFRFDHLLKLSPKFQEIAEKLPQPKVDDTRGTKFDSPVKVEVEEIIATAVGFRNVPDTLLGFDFGMYDLRQKNQASKNSEWLQKHPGEQAPYGVCWLDFLPSGDKEKAKSLPCPGGSFDCKQNSDYCK